MIYSVFVYHSTNVESVLPVFFWSVANRRRGGGRRPPPWCQTTRAGERGGRRTHPFRRGGGKERVRRGHEAGSGKRSACPGGDQRSRPRKWWVARRRVGLPLRRSVWS